MRALIVYDTCEGHTKDVAAFVASTLGKAGWDTQLARAGDAPVPQGYDLCILAASLHAGYYQAGLIDYASLHHEQLAHDRAAFISVSLSAAGNYPGDREGLERCLTGFEQATQWTPNQVYHAGGAIRFSRYGLLKRLAMKFIAAARGLRTKFGRDYDLTDYDGLARFVLHLAADRAQAIPLVKAA